MRAPLAKGACSRSFTQGPYFSFGNGLLLDNGFPIQNGTRDR